LSNVIQNLCLFYAKIEVLFLRSKVLDDTAAAILQNDKVLSNVVANQLIHNQYGGVVPELALTCTPTKYCSGDRCSASKSKYTKEQLSAIAFTQGPGLMGSLLVGSLQNLLHWL
jgi:N6-L-threonylcarbamoyladenine synthase